jgi:hypothetical protein
MWCSSRRSTDLQPLLDYVGCSILSAADVYCNFIFENFVILSPDARYVHMNFVRNRVLKFTAARQFQTDDDTEENREELDKLKKALQKLTFSAIDDRKFDSTFASFPVL